MPEPSPEKPVQHVTRLRAALQVSVHDKEKQQRVSPVRHRAGDRHVSTSPCVIEPGVVTPMKYEQDFT
jgi:hypothetical protein